VAESFGSAGTRALARSALSVVLEVAAADTYAALSCCSYYSARNTLAHLPLLNKFSQENALVVALAEDLNKGRPPERRITDCVFLLSRLVDEYPMSAVTLVVLLAVAVPKPSLLLCSRSWRVWRPGSRLSTRG
jgi:hypothetical protein